jgi:hypothetical protein
MKEQKPLRPEPEGPERVPPESGHQQQGRGVGQPGGRTAEIRTLKPGLAMQNELQTHKTRGRLGRDVQTRLGKTLQAYFDDVVKEGVPDRFKQLLDQFDERKDKGPNG